MLEKQAARINQNLLKYAPTFLIRNKQINRKTETDL